MNVRVPFVDLKSEYESIRDEVRDAIDRVLSSQSFILGSEVEAFEREIADYAHARYAIGLSSGTDALLVGLMALGVQPGDEVITTPFTFLATATTIARLGARAVFVDITDNGFNLEASEIKRAITAKTKAIVPVHLFGEMADIAAIERAAANIPILEDAAQAIGASPKTPSATSSESLAAFSFFPTKNLGAYGDAGMLTTASETLATKIRALRSHGQVERHRAESIGGNFRLDAIQAAILRVKLRHLAAHTQARRHHADRYRQLFAEAELDDLVALPHAANNHVYNQFVVRVARRDELRAFLRERGIETEVYYARPMHLQPCFHFWGHKKGDFPFTERRSNEVLALPIHPTLTEEAQRLVVSSIGDFLRKP